MDYGSSLASQLLFVGCYAAATQPGIFACSLDAATGALTARGSFAGIVNPSYLLLHPGQPWLYAVSETSQANDGVSGAVWALRWDRESMALQAVNHQPSGGDWPCHLLLDSTGKWLMVSNYGTGSVGVLPVLPDGSLGEMSHRVQHQGGSVHPERQEGPHAHSAGLTPDNRLVIVADLGIDQLVTYRLDRSAGRLVSYGQAQARPGAGPRHMTFHPGGRWLYVSNELDSTVSVFEYEASAGALREVQTLDTLPPGAPHNQVADIHVSPDGRRLYVSNRGHESIAVFEAGTDGRLARLAVQPCGGKWPRNFALAPGERFVLVANQYSDEVSVLPLAVGAAELDAVCARLDVAQPSCVQFMAG